MSTEKASNKITIGPTGWKDLGYEDAMTEGEDRHLFIEQKSHFILNHTKSHTVVMRNEILLLWDLFLNPAETSAPARCALPTGSVPTPTPWYDTQESAFPTFCSQSATFVLRDRKNHGKYKLCPRRAKLGRVQTNKEGITIVIPTTAGLMKSAEVRGIPWLFSHTVKKTSEKHNITRMNPRTWGRDRKHTGMNWNAGTIYQTELSKLPGQ